MTRAGQVLYQIDRGLLYLDEIEIKAIRSTEMKKRDKRPVVILFIALSMILSACQSYERRVVPAKLPSTYPNAIDVAGAVIATKAYDDKKEAEALFGFDIVGAGAIPVQVVFDNRGEHTLQIVPDQTLMVDEQSNIWPILDASLAYERIAKKTQFGEIAPEAAKGGVLAGLAGAVIGAAIGVVTGTNVGRAAGIGAAVGAAAGSVAGGTKGYFSEQPKDKIREDLQKRTLENKPIMPNQLAYGFLFFPGEAAKCKELRIGIKEKDTTIVHALILKF
jgi:hypothetical protein